MWDAGTAAATASTQGSITVNGSWTNATAGFEVLTHTGTGANGTVGHNLGAKPDLIISKNTTGSADNWFVYHSALGATKYITSLASTPVGGVKAIPSCSSFIL